MDPWPITFRGVVGSWEIDMMGHMNVTWYVAKFNHASWTMFDHVGLNAEYLLANNVGVAAVQENLSYKRELHAGDRVFIRTQLKSLREKVFVYGHEMIREDTGEVAATCEITGVCIDTVARKSRPFDAEIAARIRERMESTVGA